MARRPLFDPFLGQPQRVPPQPTPRQMQMQAALRAAAPRGGGRGWQAGGYITQTPTGPPTGPGPATPFQPGVYTPHQMNPPYGSGLAGVRGPLGPSQEDMVRRNQVLEARGLPPMAGWAQGPINQVSRTPVVDVQPRGWNIGGTVDVVEDLMAERDRLQQQLQMADEVTAQEIMAQIMEINKELEMAAAPGMAGGGIASLMGI